MHRLCVCADFLPALGICACKHASSFCLVPQWEVYPELVWLVWSFRILVAGMTQRPSCAWGKCSIRFGSTSMSKVLISLYLVILFASECVRPVWLPTSSPFIFTCLFIFMSTAAAGTLPLFRLEVAFTTLATSQHQLHHLLRANMSMDDLFFAGLEDPPELLQSSSKRKTTLADKD